MSRPTRVALGALAILMGSLWACAPAPQSLQSARQPQPQAPPRDAAPRPAPSVPTSSSDHMAGVEERALAAVNAHRASAGLRPMDFHPRLAEIARVHSRAMAQGITPLGHEGFSQRAAQVRSEMPARGFAENVSKSSRPLHQVSDAAVRGWLSSAIHRKNIEGRYTGSGIGAAQDAQGTTYMTQIFVGN